MDKKPQISLTVGKFEPVVFFKVLTMLLLVISILSVLGASLMGSSPMELIQSQGVYRFVLLPVMLAGGIAYITRHSTLKVTNTGKRKLGKLMVETVLVEGYELKKDKDQVMVFVPEDSHFMKLSQWMENMTVTVRFRNQNMTLVGPRRIVTNIADKVMFGQEFKAILNQSAH